MSQVLIEFPDMFENNRHKNDFEFYSEITQEVESQVKRRLMALYGSSLNFADGVSLYANSVDTVKHVYDVNHNKNGNKNKNRNIFGHNFEALEVGAANRSGIMDNSGRTARTTDQLYKDKKSGSLENNNLEQYAKYNHQYTDIVIHKNGEIIQTQQLKYTQNIENLYESAYTTHENAPDKIIVPKDMLKVQREALKSKLIKETDPDTKKRIQIALNKLKGGKTYAIESHLPNLSVALRTGKDTTLRVGENVAKAALQEVALFAAGGAIWEIKDAYANPYEFTFMERLQRLFLAILDKLRGLTFVRFAKELALEIFNAVLGFLKSTFKSISHFFSLLGKAVFQVWESICDYCTGKIKSFSDLVTVVTKSLSAVGFGFLAIALEKQLIAIGIPTPIAAIMAAAFAGLGITLINKILDGGIEGLVFAITSAFSGAEAAHLRYESIAEYCDEILPKIVEEREKFQKMVDAYYAERANIFAYSFSEIRSSVAAKDSLKLLASLESLNKAYGRTLGWSTQEEFDEMMVNSHRPFVL